MSKKPSVKLRVLGVAIISMFTSACSQISVARHDAAERQPVTSFFDYQLMTEKDLPIALPDFAAEIQDADVVLVGEWHTHTGIHRFQTELLGLLAQQQAKNAQSSKLALSMEQFTRNKQSVVNQYLANEIGEATLIKEGNAWDNYTSDYRPLVELAKANKLDIIAANAPKSIVRCIGQQGVSYLDKLPRQERAWAAQSIATQDSAYKRLFLSSMHHGSDDKAESDSNIQTENQFAAQVTWDETMAESIVNYLAQNPNSKVMHIAGKFHIENGLGTAASILSRNPDLKIAIVTPVGVNDSADNKLAKKASLQGKRQDVTQYQLQVIAPPKQYVQTANMMAAYKSLSKRNDDLVCL